MNGRAAAGLVLCLSLAVVPPAAADFSRDDRGSATANFLKLGTGARAAGMGGAFTAAADDASALYWNPAALTQIPSGTSSALFMHAPYVASSYFDYAGFAQHLGRGQAWGASAQYFTAGTLSQTDRLGNTLGDFTPYDLAFTAGYAKAWIGGPAIGISGKWIRSKIIESAQTFAADIGLLSPRWFNDRLRLGAAVSQLGGKMTFESESSRLPLTARLGAAYQLTPVWLLTTDAIFPIDNGPAGAIGTEYRWRLGVDSFLAGRVGVNSRTLGDLDGVNGLSAGVGFLFRKLSVDYAFLPMGELGLTHRISLGLRFGEEQVERPEARIRSPRQASRRETTCEELYGAINCREPYERIEPPAPSAAPGGRPW
jgi:hypothetical protein